MATSGERATHWNTVYRNAGSETVSWFQEEPAMSLQMTRLLGIETSTAVIDVGGGASLLADRLVADGFDDVSILDLSAVALEEARRRLGDSRGVRWLHQDVLSWRPTRRFGLWHDRAVFHFLTNESDRARYLATLSESLEPGAGLVMATFADDGPEHCSGLPVARYSAQELVGLLGERFRLVLAQRELHTTPAGTVQPFTWVAGTYR